LDDSGNPENFVVRAYHRGGEKQPWVPGATTRPKNLDEFENEVVDLEKRAIGKGWKRTTRRGNGDGFDKDSLPEP
jgi:hypothetical protein